MVSKLNVHLRALYLVPSLLLLRHTQARQAGGADGVAMADILHYGRTNIADIRAVAKSNGLGVRRYE
jgi:hypothetical protein